MIKTNIFISIVIYIFALSTKASSNLAEEGQIARSLKVIEQNLNKKKLDSPFVEAIKRGLKNKEDREYFEKLASRWQKQPQWTFVANFNFLEFRVSEKVVSTFAIKQKNPLIVVIDAKEYPLDKDQSLVNQIKRIYQKKEKLKTSNWFQQLFLPRAEAEVQTKSNSPAIELEVTIQDREDISIINAFVGLNDPEYFKTAFLTTTYCSDLRKKLGISKIKNSNQANELRITFEGSSAEIDMRYISESHPPPRWQHYYSSEINSDVIKTIIDSNNKILTARKAALESEIDGYLKKENLQFTVECPSFFKPCVLKSKESGRSAEQVLTEKENIEEWLKIKYDGISNLIKKQIPLNCEHFYLPDGHILIPRKDDACRSEFNVPSLSFDKDTINSFNASQLNQFFKTYLNEITEARKPAKNPEDALRKGLLFDQMANSWWKVTFDLIKLRVTQLESDAQTEKGEKKPLRTQMENLEKEIQTVPELERLSHLRASAMISALRCCGRDNCRAELLEKTGVNLNNDKPQSAK